MGFFCLFFKSPQKKTAGLPWWQSRWDSACQRRGYRFDLWSRKIPHATEHLSPCHNSWAYALQRVKMKVVQLCLTLCDPMDYTVHGILQARILEWVAFPFSRGSSQPRGQTQVSSIAGGFFTSGATGEAPQQEKPSQWEALTQQQGVDPTHCN